MEPSRLSDASVTDLAKNALEQGRELVRVELELAKDELRQEARNAAFAAASFIAAGALAVVALAAFAAAAILAFGATALAALGVGGFFVVVAGIAAGVGYANVPSKAVPESAQRVEADVAALKEHAA